MYLKSHSELNIFSQTPIIFPHTRVIIAAGVFPIGQKVLYTSTYEQCAPGDLYMKTVNGKLLFTRMKQIDSLYAEWTKMRKVNFFYASRVQRHFKKAICVIVPSQYRN